MGESSSGILPTSRAEDPPERENVESGAWSLLEVDHKGPLGKPHSFYFCASRCAHSHKEPWQPCYRGNYIRMLSSSRNGSTESFAAHSRWLYPPLKKNRDPELGLPRFVLPVWQSQCRCTTKAPSYCWSPCPSIMIIRWRPVLMGLGTIIIEMKIRVI